MKPKPRSETCSRSTPTSASGSAKPKFDWPSSRKGRCNPSRPALAGLLALAAVVTTAAAQKKPASNYQRADFIRRASKFIDARPIPHWLEDSVRFWYESADRQEKGLVYIVDPISRSKRPLFESARMASALSAAADTSIIKLPGFEVKNGGAVVRVVVKRRAYHCDPANYTCAVADSSANVRLAARPRPEWAARSPDGKWDVFAFDHDIYVRPASITDAELTAAGRERRGTVATDSAGLPVGSIRISSDGSRLFSFARAQQETPDSSTRRLMPIDAVWSPDGRRFAIYREDRRNLRVFPLYSSTGDYPVAHNYYYAVPSDSVVPTFETYVVDPKTRAMVRVKAPPTPVAAVTPAMRWNRQGDRLFVLNANRGPSRISLLGVNPIDGQATTVIRDSSKTFVELSHIWGSSNFEVVNGGDDLIWFSERDGWGHLYRFGPNGVLKNQIDSGSYTVDRIIRVDSVAKVIFFTAWGREPGVPYFTRLYRINFDGTDLTLLTNEPAVHAIGEFDPRGEYFVDSYSRPEMPPITVLRSSATGEVIVELGRGDLGYLKTLGWTPPEIVSVKARDGVTDLWGLLYRPSDFDSTKKYPIIDHIYPGPQAGSVSSWGFGGFDDGQSLAELGFVVLELDHMGTIGRSKAFHDAFFGNMGDNGIPDHVEAIKQLAKRHRWIDLERVGIFGFSGGGFASTDAIFRYPDFFKVAVSISGNHHPNSYGWYWATRYQGAYDKASYDSAANYTLAKNLKGRLLLIHGDLDNNVHPANTLRVVDALIKANKNFDMLIIPDAGHGLVDYATRRTWDYFVQHLLGAEPQKEYRMMNSFQATRPGYGPY